METKIKIGRGIASFWFDTATLSDEKYRRALTIGITKMIRNKEIDARVTLSEPTAKLDKDRLKEAYAKANERR